MEMIKEIMEAVREVRSNYGNLDCIETVITSPSCAPMPGKDGLVVRLRRDFVVVAVCLQTAPDTPEENSVIGTLLRKWVPRLGVKDVGACIHVVSLLPLEYRPGIQAGLA
jgi:hypothetical protein